MTIRQNGILFNIAGCIFTLKMLAYEKTFSYQILEIIGIKNPFEKRIKDVIITQKITSVQFSSVIHLKAIRLGQYRIL